MSAAKLPHFNLIRIKKQLQKINKEQREKRKFSFLSKAAIMQKYNKKGDSVKIWFEGVETNTWRVIDPPEMEWMELYKTFKKELKENFPGISFSREDDYFILPDRDIERFIKWTGTELVTSLAIEEYPDSLGKKIRRQLKSNQLADLTENTIDQIYEEDGGAVDNWIQPFDRPEDKDRKIYYIWSLHDAWGKLRSAMYIE